MVMQYVRMIFHVDLIKFNLMVKKTSENITYIRELYDIIGDVESAIAVASFRTYLKETYGVYTVPEFRDNGKISCEKIYHPLIKDAVKNSMRQEHSVLLTGSNASGKSTYLKTVALNAILSQTIYTAAAEYFQMPKSEVYSSMALRDDLSSNDSYYMAEIKSLKRILDRAADGHPVLCFIDEVLRGTNTIERIAASSEILKKLRAENVICFAATHDIELTYILEGEYSNYHFEEEVTKEDVCFNYHLNKGRTVTRNAIRLLQTLNYPKEIVEGAYAQVAEFTETGKWKSVKI
jgi:DNA mismatch repair ATPase MutS